ncbi:cytochrome P450, partial [Nonomuraea sp. RK-328]|nr:cytochrome P450 [Nonomuraea sp. RK-328]
VRNRFTDWERSVPLETIDLFDPEHFRSGSQHPAWRALRSAAPLWQQSGPYGTRFWSVTRYADVLRVIKDHRRFSSEYGTILAVLNGDTAGGRTINLMDPPHHAAIRVPTMPLLSTSAMTAAAGEIRERVRKIIAPAVVGDPVDVAELALRLPMAAVGHIVGVPEDLWPDVTRWTMAGVAPGDPHYAMGTTAETLRTVHSELFDLFGSLIEERRARPRNDLISRLLEVEVDGRRLSVEDVVLNSFSFVMGANTTTPHVAAHLLLALAEFPDQWRQARDGAASVSSVVEEALRWTTPTNHLVRRTREPVEIAGVRLEAGESVCAWVASANRDETMFDDPYELRVGRRPNRHLAFGEGVHYCNGAPAARTVLRVLVEELLEHTESFEVQGAVEHLYSNFINGITALPMRLVPVRQPRPTARSAVMNPASARH